MNSEKFVTKTENMNKRFQISKKGKKRKFPSFKYDKYMVINRVKVIKTGA